MEGRLEVMGWRGRRRDQLQDYLKEKMGRGNTRSRLWRTRFRRQWTCRKTDYGMKCASVSWCLQLSATSSLSSTQSLYCYFNVSLCCNVCLHLMTNFFLSISQSTMKSVCLSAPYSHFLPVSQSVSQSFS